MGFFVNEETPFPNYGITISNSYITIKACYTQHKSPVYTPGPNNQQIQSIKYSVIARWYVYATKSEALQSLKDDTISVAFDEVPVNPIAALYAAIKEQHFVGKTFTDDL